MEQNDSCIAIMVGFDQMIFDSNGVSTMSMEDYAVALVDELETRTCKKCGTSISGEKPPAG